MMPDKKKKTYNVGKCMTKLNNTPGASGGARRRRSARTPGHARLQRQQGKTALSGDFFSPLTSVTVAVASFLSYASNILFNWHKKVSLSI